MLVSTLKNESNGTFTYFGGKLRRFLHGSIFSRVGASTKPGVVQIAFSQRLLSIGQAPFPTNRISFGHCAEG